MSGGNNALDLEPVEFPGVIIPGERDFGTGTSKKSQNEKTKKIKTTTVTKPTHSKTSSMIKSTPAVSAGNALSSDLGTSINSKDKQDSIVQSELLHEASLQNESINRRFKDQSDLLKRAVILFDYQHEVDEAKRLSYNAMTKSEYLDIINDEDKKGLKLMGIVKNATELDNEKNVKTLIDAFYDINYEVGALFGEMNRSKEVLAKAEKNNEEHSAIIANQTKLVSDLTKLIAQSEKQFTRTESLMRSCTDSASLLERHGATLTKQVLEHQDKATDKKDDNNENDRDKIRNAVKKIKNTITLIKSSARDCVDDMVKAINLVILMSIVNDHCHVKTVQGLCVSVLKGILAASGEKRGNIMLLYNALSEEKEVDFKRLLRRAEKSTGERELEKESIKLNLREYLEKF
jgi:hypothetical protein